MTKPRPVGLRDDEVLGLDSILANSSIKIRQNIEHYARSSPEWVELNMSE